MLGQLVARSTSQSQEAASEKRPKRYEARVKFLEIFVRYALKHFWQFLNKRLCSNWLDCICTRSTQAPVAGPCVDDILILSNPCFYDMLCLRLSFWFPSDCFENNFCEYQTKLPLMRPIAHAISEQFTTLY